MSFASLAASQAVHLKQGALPGHCVLVRLQRYSLRRNFGEYWHVGPSSQAAEDTAMLRTAASSVPVSVEG